MTLLIIFAVLTFTIILASKFKIWPDTIFIILAALLGFIVFVLTPHVIPKGIKVEYDSPVFPFIRNAVENFSIFPTSILMFLNGILLGYIRPSIWWLLGLFTMFLFPIAAIIEMNFAPTSHNLWPFEFIIYAVLSTPAILGAFVGRGFRTGKWELL